jgi:hypothetical protein
MSICGLVERNSKIAKDELIKMKVMNGAQDNVLRLEMSTKIFAQKFLQLTDFLWLK